MSLFSRLRGMFFVCALFATASGAFCQTYQLIVSNEDTAFSVKSAAWALDKTGTFFHSFKFSAPGPGTGANLSVWTLDGIPPGQYLVEFYVDNGNYAAAAEYGVESDAGLTTVTKSQNYAGTGWHNLGTFQFTNAGRITQSDHWTGAGTKVIADTLRLTFQGTPQVPTVDVVSPSISICIDDLGALDPNNPSSYTYQLFANAPEFTYAVMPSQTYGTAVLQAAQAKGIETLMHQPMQYVGQPDTNPSDPTRLYVGMTDAQILTSLRANLDAQAPYVVGVNNHQGSRFSQYRHGMDIVLAELKSRNLFFYDSRTIADSIAYDAEKEAGMLSGERDLFIDGIPAQATRDYVMSLAMQAKYSPNYSYMGIGHQRVDTVPGLLLALGDLQSSGVAVRRISRTLACIVESDAQPAGASFTRSGAWQRTDSDMISQECNDGDAFAAAGGAAASARFTPSLPKEGSYHVFVGFTAGAANCDTVKVTMHGKDGDHTFTLDQTREPNRWHHVGLYSFAAGAAGYVTVDNSLCSNPGHVTKADCVKLTYDGPAPSAVGDWQMY